MPYYTYLLHSEKKSSESWELHWETKILDPVNSECDIKFKKSNNSITIREKNNIIININIIIMKNIWS